MILQETYTLSNGVEIPKLGLGTWFIDNRKAASAVKEAVKIGYRHLDTALAYGNEEGVGEGIRTSGVSRNEIFVTTKLAAEVKSYEKAVEAIDGSLTATGLDHLDLMIIHSPPAVARVPRGGPLLRGQPRSMASPRRRVRRGQAARDRRLEL
jgi:diketogulonate reductase-like aldo/keto reductase